VTSARPHGALIGGPERVAAESDAIGLPDSDLVGLDGSNVGKLDATRAGHLRAQWKRLRTGASGDVRHPREPPILDRPGGP
jgi:hypothetical protein